MTLDQGGMVVPNFKTKFHVLSRYATLLVDYNEEEGVTIRNKYPFS